MNPRRVTATLFAGVALSLAGAGEAHADPYRWTLYGDVAVARACTPGERAAVIAEPDETCQVVPRLDQGTFEEGDPAWCWPDRNSAEWIKQARKRWC